MALIVALVILRHWYDVRSASPHHHRWGGSLWIGFVRLAYRWPLVAIISLASWPGAVRHPAVTMTVRPATKAGENSRPRPCRAANPAAAMPRRSL